MVIGAVLTVMGIFFMLVNVSIIPTDLEKEERINWISNTYMVTVASYLICLGCLVFSFSFVVIILFKKEGMYY